MPLPDGPDIDFDLRPSPRLSDLYRNLDHPIATVSPQTLMGQWRRSILTITLPRPRGLEDGPWVPAAIRGALGRALMNMAQTEIEAAEALHILFHMQRPLTSRLFIPRPMVIKHDIERDQLRVEIVLFGVFDFWRDWVFDAALDAMQTGLPLKERGSLRVPWEVSEADWMRDEAIAPKAASEPPLEARMHFVTPVSLGGSSAQGRGLELGDLIMSLLDRISGLARWNFLKLDGQWGHWRSRSREIRHRIEYLRPGDWQRGSTRGGPHKLDMAGWYLDLVFEEPEQDLLPILILGETSFAGASAVHGAGRYTLTLTSEH